MYHPRTDQYIDNAAEFAKPILRYLRELIHSTCPDVTESIKWGFPHFDYKGKILCNMAAFKQHCAFGFWYASEIDDGGLLQKSERTAMGQLGRITSLKDLPDDEALRNMIIQVIEKIDRGDFVTEKKPKVQKGPVETPPYLRDLLKRNKLMAEHFAAFTDAQRREYIEWFEDAKTEATREKRLSTAEEWIMDGKTRNWKYQKK